MARVHTATARKDYPAQGISKGHKYWYWTPYRSGKRMSATRPTPSMTESNSTRAGFYALVEQAERDLASAANTIEDIKAVLEAAADRAEGIAEELREKQNNIEDGFGHPTHQSEEFEQQAEGVEEWAGTLRDAVEVEEPVEVEVPEEPVEPVEPEGGDFPTKAEFESAYEEYMTAVKSYEGDKEAYDEAVEERDWQQSPEDALKEAQGEAQGALGEAPDI